MKYDLVTALLGLNNTVTTLISDLFEAQVDEVTEETVNNSTLTAQLINESWFIAVTGGDYTVIFNEKQKGYMPSFDKTLEEAIPALTSFMDEEETEQFTNEIATISTRMKDIQTIRDNLSDNQDSLYTQSLLAVIVSNYFAILRWLEDSEVIGLDETVMYIPSIDVLTDGHNKSLTIDNNVLPASLDINTGELTVRNGSMSLETFVEVSLKDEDRDDVIFYVNQRVNEIKQACAPLADLV